MIEMFGGWYNVIIRNGRTVAFLHGPMKTRDELPPLVGIEKKLMQIRADYDYREGDEYETVFYVAPVLRPGVLNGWMKITHEPWRMT